MIFAAGEAIRPVDVPDPVRAAIPRYPEYSPNLREPTAEFEGTHILRGRRARERPPTPGV